MIAAFNAQCSTVKVQQNPSEILARIAETNSWNSEDITLLASLAVSEYYELFMSQRGHDLRKTLKASLQFDSIENATPEMREILSKAKDALRQIGQQSKINALRVKSYGVSISEPSPNV